MKVSYNWLQDYFEEKLPSPDDMKEKLSLHSFEVESIEKKDGDHIFNIDILPNRAHDALGYLGVAREVSLIYDRDLKFPKIEYEEALERSSDYIGLNVESSLVRRAAKRVVLDVEVTESPDWLKERLSSMDQRSINNIVDITNFVMWETGQPVHAFDLDKIIDSKITIREAHDREKITTLDGKEYTLSKGMLVISDSEKPLDIAGIKGGNSSGIDEKTKRIVLSVCSFDPTWIRKTSTALDLKTDASYRFERDLSPTKVQEAIERLSSLVSSIASGKVLQEILDVYPNPPESGYKITTSLDRVNKVLGSSISKDELENILNKLKKHSKFDWEGEYTVTIPSERIDLLPSEVVHQSGNEEDLIEEIGRVYGFYKISSILPVDFPFKPDINKEVSQVESLKDGLVSRGFSEVMTYSFVESGDVKLANPLSADKKYLRRSLKDGLRKSLEQSTHNAPLFGKTEVKIFEIGKVFSKGIEKLSLGLAVSLKNKKEEQVFLEDILSTLGLRGEVEGGVALVEIDGNGADTYEDLDFDISRSVTFRKISAYPFVLRDLALWVPEAKSSKDILDIINNSGGELLVSSTLFDEFKKEGRVSFAFRLVFQSNERTLTDLEIGQIMSKIEEKLTQNEGWKVR